jgi:hypothetical protein
MFSFPLQILDEIFLTPRRPERDIIENVYWSSCTVRDILALFYLNFNILDCLSKNISTLNSTKIRRVGAELLHAERQTDRHVETNNRFWQFC